MTWQPGWNTPTPPPEGFLEPFTRAAAVRPDSVFLDFSGETATYAEVNRRIEATATALGDLGVQPGDRVSSMLDNSLDAVTVWYATCRLGAVYVPHNTAHRGEFLRHELEDAAARVIVVERDLLDRVLAVEDHLSEPGRIVTRGEPPPERAGMIPFTELLATRRGPLPELPAAHDLACIVYTGGTTGPAKGCMLAHAYVAHIARMTLGDRKTGEVGLTSLPLFHLNAMSAVVQTSLIASRLAVLPRFSVSGFWPEVERSGATIAWLLGTMTSLLAEAPDTEAMQRCKGQLRRVLAVPFPPEVQQVFIDRFGLREPSGAGGYGMTEAAPLTFQAPDQPSKPGASGKQSPFFDVRIFDEADRELPCGEIGEIVCRPSQPHVMFQGYWRRPEATAAATSHLWFHTGDLGRFDEHGYLFFVDRKKDYLRRRGENVSSLMVEAVLRRHPAVADAAVFGVPSELGEDDIKTSLILEAGATLTAEDLCRWAAEELPFFAVPRYVEFVDDLPRSPVGRVLKRELREDWKTPGTWDREAAGLKLARR